MFLPELKKNRGFSLVEAMVAVSIFAFAIVAPLQISIQSLQASLSVKDQMIAMGLARDAIEYINYKRTENAMAGISWTDGFWTPSENAVTLCGSVGGCKIDTSVFSAEITQNDDAPLRFDPATGFYGYNVNWPVSKYTRVVKINGIDDANDPQRQVNVEVSVSWEFALGVVKTVTLKESLFNWVIEEKI